MQASHLYALCVKLNDLKRLVILTHFYCIAARLSDDFLVAGSTTVVDVINSVTGKMVHVFETKKDKIRSLELLVARGNKLYLFAEEEKDGSRTAAVILIEVSYV